jgi:hypothetical protein
VNLLSRKVALASGVTRYFTGKPCPYGHTSERLVSTRACAACASTRKQAWNSSNPEKRNAQKRNWVNANLDKVKALKSAEQKRNRPAATARARKYREANLEKTRAAKSAWAKANPAKGAAKTSAYRAKRLNATPAWADQAKIDEYYETANGLSMLLGEWYHVDHVIPLQGKTVCGLHVHNNLQILTAYANQSKSNSYKEY